jgi:hypothetical protein
MTSIKTGAPEWLILTGAGLFIFILALSAVFQADIRWLHFFQAWMYIAAVILSLRGNRLGYFIGFSAAVLWDYGNLSRDKLLSQWHSLPCALGSHGAP